LEIHEPALSVNTLTIVFANKLATGSEHCENKHKQGYGHCRKKDLYWGSMETALGISVFTLLFNIPFGYWREGTRKFSKGWFLAVHLPVPFIVAARLWFGASWHWIPLFLLSFFLGQWIGAKIRRRMQQTREELSLCMVMDMLRSRE